MTLYNKHAAVDAVKPQQQTIEGLLVCDTQVTPLSERATTLLYTCQAPEQTRATTLHHRYPCCCMHVASVETARGHPVCTRTVPWQQCCLVLYNPCTQLPPSLSLTQTNRVLWHKLDTAHPTKGYRTAAWQLMAHAQQPASSTPVAPAARCSRAAHHSKTHVGTHDPHTRSLSLRTPSVHHHSVATHPSDPRGPCT